MTDNINQSVCAVVVTYNRKELLLECLDSLLKQSRPVQGIYIIDNFSTDGTPESLLDAGYISELPPGNLNNPWEKEFVIANLTDRSHLKIHYVRMHENTGGAGGFYEGVKKGYERGYDWLWLMDDDVICHEDALLKLNDSLVVVGSAGFVCSKVINNDNEVMNVPVIDMSYGKTMYPNWPKYIEYGIIPLKNATFVSILVNSRYIKNIGLPLKAMFIWGDDTEYTYRISSKYRGYMVGESIVIHKRKISKPPSLLYEKDRKRIKNFFYMYRNQLFIQKKYGTKKSILLYFLNLIKHILKIIVFGKNKFYKLFIMMTGTFSGLFFNPKVKFPKIHH
jgi:GT2 family glycosyltransferase